jgi:hypothetical protein
MLNSADKFGKVEARTVERLVHTDCGMILVRMEGHGNAAPQGFVGAVYPDPVNETVSIWGRFLQKLHVSANILSLKQ